MNILKKWIFPKPYLATDAHIDFCVSEQFIGAETAQMVLAHRRVIVAEFLKKCSKTHSRKKYFLFTIQSGGKWPPLSIPHDLLYSDKIVLLFYHFISRSYTGRAVNHHLSPKLYNRIQTTSSHKLTYYHEAMSDKNESSSSK